MKSERIIPVDFSFRIFKEVDTTMVELKIDGYRLHGFTMTSLGDLQWIVAVDLKRKGNLMSVLENLRGLDRF